MAEVNETTAASTLTERVRVLVDRMHTEGRTPKQVTAALAYELAAEIAYGAAEFGAPSDAAFAVVDEFAQMMKMQMVIFGRDRHP